MSSSQRYITGFLFVWCMLALGGCHEDVPEVVEAGEAATDLRFDERIRRALESVGKLDKPK